MRVLRFVTIGLGGLVALLLVAVLTIVLLVDPNDYRDDVERLVEQRTGRPLTIGGPLELRFFPWLALGAQKLSLGNPPGFTGAPLLEVQNARVGVRLLPLLSQRLEVSRVALEGLAVSLVQRADGRANWEGLFDEQAGGEQKGAAVRETSIAGIDVTRSSLVFRNEAEKSTTRLRDLELHAGRLGGADPVPLELAFTMDEGEGTEATQLALTTRARMPSGATRIELADMTLEGKMLGAPEEDEPPVPFKVKSEQVTLDWEAETLAPAKLEIDYAGIPLSASVDGERLFGERVLRGEFTAPKFSLRQALPALGVELPADLPAGRLEAVQGQGRFTLTENALEVESLTATLDESRISGGFALVDLEAFAMRFDLAIDALDVDRYFPPEPEGETASPAGAAAGGRSEGAGGPSAEEEPFEIPRELLAELDARGTLRIGRFTVAELPFADLRTTVDAGAGLVKLGPTQAKLFGGGYRGMTTIDVRRKPARLQLDERVQGLDLAPLLAATVESKRLSGRATSTAALTAQGDTDSEILRTLNGRLEFDVADGALEGMDLWHELRRARALWQREALPERPAGPPRTSFRTLRGRATLADGVMSSDDLRAELDYVSVTGKGTLAISTGALDYRLVAEVFKLPPEGAGAEMAAVRAAEIPLTVTGTFADIKVRPDFDVLVKQRVKQEVEEKVEEKKEELKQKLEDKLKDLLGR
jgi:AsmA protein